MTGHRQAYETTHADNSAHFHNLTLWKCHAIATACRHVPSNDRHNATIRLRPKEWTQALKAVSGCPSVRGVVSVVLLAR